MLTVAVPKWNILQKIIVLTPKDGRAELLPKTLLPKSVKK